jgi:hypothetical protein
MEYDLPLGRLNDLASNNPNIAVQWFIACSRESDASRLGNTMFKTHWWSNSDMLIILDISNVCNIYLYLSRYWKSLDD